MTEIMDLLKGQLSKMNVDGSWVFGAVTGGLTIAIPQWVYTQGWSLNHTILIGILIGIISFEWIVGGRLATVSTDKQRSSRVAIDSLIRDVLIIGICAMGLGLDQLFSTGSIIYTIITAAFIYHNFYSLMANIVVLRWDKHFPMWLLTWLDNEIAVKKEKYFPINKKEEK
ncbi:bacteriophage phi-29 gp14 holin [Trichococcus palustris]|uniref:Bacteriophage phi-29 gp14 holin n=1 Tax=Trichococcus palustris TaxID=140314 RepID=A0A143Y9Z7_9LACT|nr:phage holin family protein [Trichococcus palustris]CZQ84660.1 bacteriophage phi-29 gp14 holin [Trichococcus palustris]SFK53693.1 Bacteriophage holin family protein [Trichococcus palustris]